MDKKILITGATDGIGMQTAIELSKLGNSIIIHGRSKNKCEATLAKLEGSSHQYIVFDLSSFTQINEGVEQISNLTDRIDVLINNAGVYMNEFTLSEDGYENTFAVNHLGHFLLTIKTLNLIRNSNYKRIINVSSIAHTRGKLNLDTINNPDFFSPYGAYSQSKLANILFTLFLANKLQNEDIKVNCLHPGVIDTKLLNAGFNIKGADLLTGSKTSIFLAEDKSVDNISGKYFNKSAIEEPANIVYDTYLQNELWKYSEDAVKDFLDN